MPLYTYQKLINKLDQARSTGDVEAVLVEVCKHYGFDFVDYIAQVPTSFVKPETIHISTYPSAWLRRYRRQKYADTDPFVRLCSEKDVPLQWSYIKDQLIDNTRAARFIREAGSYGLRNGLSIPVRTRKGESAVMSFGMDRDGPKAMSEIQKSMPDLCLLSVYSHESAMRIAHGERLSIPLRNLTKREKECLVWVAEGETTWDIANRLEVTESTVIFHLQNSMKKLGASNRQQAIAKAVLLGLITPDF